MEENWKKLLEYIANNLSVSSPYMYVDQYATIDVDGLLEEIAQLRGISNEENGAQFNAIMNSIEQNEDDLIDDDISTV